MKGLWTLLLAIVFVVVGFFLFKNKQENIQQYSKVESTSERSPQASMDWGEYLKTQAGSYFTGSSWNPDRVFKKLTEDTSWQGGAWQCLERLKGFSLTQARNKRRLLNKPENHSFKFNFEISDQDYQSTRLGKDHYELSRKMKKDLDGSRPNFWNEQKWREWDGYKGEDGNENWSVLQYRSRTVLNPGGFPQSLQRVLVLREVADSSGKALYDQWIQFTVHPQRDQGELNRNVTKDKPFNPVGKGVQKLVDFISVRFRDDQPAEGELTNEEDGSYVKPLLSFRQFWRDNNGFNPKDRLSATGSLDTCYSCHANGMRWVSPYPSSVSNQKLASGSDKTQKEVFDHFGSRMDSYGQVSWGKAVTPENYGPPLGRKVGCVACHNNWEGDSVASVSRGAINWGFSPGHAIHKMSSDASMPMNDRGAHGIARQFVRDFLWGNKEKGIEGDTARKIHQKWLKGPGLNSGNFPSLSRAVRDIGNANLGSDESAKDARLKQAKAAARIAESHNQSYKEFLFSGRNYSRIYRRQTRDWLLNACDQEISEDDLRTQSLSNFNESALPEAQGDSQLNNSQIE